jgi:hypothetical protein
MYLSGVNPPSVVDVGAADDGRLESRASKSAQA